MLLGSTFIERAQSHGYLETALTSRFPGANVQFRNLGWSGDNVFGEARAGFGPVAEGFKHLKDHVLALKPTVILLNYGANESFARHSGARTISWPDSTRLLATLDETGARIVFLTPPPQEDLGRPLPDPEAAQSRSEALHATRSPKSPPSAARRSSISTSCSIPSDLDAGGPVTDNGIHLTAYGYWLAAPRIEAGAGLAAARVADCRRCPAGQHLGPRHAGQPGQVLADGRFASSRTTRTLPLAPPPGDAPADSSGAELAHAARV